VLEIRPLSFTSFTTPRSVSAAIGLGTVIALSTLANAGSECQRQPATTEHLLIRTVDGASAADLNDMHTRAGVVSIDWTCTLVPGLRCVSVPAGSAPAAIAALNAHPMVRYAEVDHPRHKMGQNTPYGVTSVDAPLEWPASKGRGVIVAHLDTGIDLTHPDLPAPALTRSFVEGVSSAQDGDGHGTHTAGTIVAKDNRVGVVGVAPSATLIVGKVLDDSGGGTDSGLIAGIDWAVANHARVITMSLGGYDNTQSLHDACAAARSAGVLVVAAAGNDDTSAPSYPAAYASVVSVGAVDSENNRADFSNFGRSVDVVAPGVEVLSTYVGGPFATWRSVQHNARVMQGSGSVNASGKAIFCGFGESASAFPASVSGQVAHIRRGGPDSQAVTFHDKVQNALASGAIGVVISNNTRGRINGTLDGSVSIPVLEISQTDGDDLEARSGVAAKLCTGGCATYETLSGTSMSCPHVAGVAALLFAAVPSATPAQVLTAMEKTALDLGDPGRDNMYGWGLVRADLAARYLRRHVSRAQAASAETVSPAPAANLLSFLDDYFAGNAAADMNDDGHDDTYDLFVFLQQWLGAD
jgi:subtilisin family serine protease